MDDNGLVRYTDYIADDQGYRILRQHKSYITHEDENAETAVSTNDIENEPTAVSTNHIENEPTAVSTNEIENEPTRKVIKRRRARKRNIDQIGVHRTMKRRLGMAETAQRSFNVPARPFNGERLLDSATSLPSL